MLAGLVRVGDPREQVAGSLVAAAVAEGTRAMSRRPLLTGAREGLGVRQQRQERGPRLRVLRVSRDRGLDPALPRPAASDRIR